MKGKLLLLAGAAVGYVMGTAAGRERFEQLKRTATRVKDDPRVRDAADQAAGLAREKGAEVAGVAREKGTEVADKAKSAVQRNQGGDGSAGDKLNPDSTHFQDDPYPKGDLP